VLVDTALQVPDDMAIEIEFRPLDEVGGHVLLEACTTSLVVEPDSLSTRCSSLSTSVMCS
jgi:hypothetical protein